MKTLERWRGFVESKLRRLSKLIETNIINTFLDICLYPMPFSGSDKNYRNSIVYYYGLKIKPTILMELQDNSKFINFMPFISWFIEHLERNERVPSQMNIEITLIKYSKIEKNHLRELENRTFSNIFQNRMVKNKLKFDRNRNLFNNDYIKKSFYSEKMMNEEETTSQNSIFTFNKKLKHIF